MTVHVKVSACLLIRGKSVTMGFVLIVFKKYNLMTIIIGFSPSWEWTEIIGISHSFGETHKCKNDSKLQITKQNCNTSLKCSTQVTTTVLCSLIERIDYYHYQPVFLNCLLLLRLYACFPLQKTRMIFVINWSTHMSQWK